MKITFVLIVVFFLTVSVLGADLEPYLKSAAVPFFPVLARQARLMGKISLHFTINEQGETSDIEASTGPKLLQDAAIENVHNWKFWPPRCACRVKREAVLVYNLSPELRSAPETPTATVKWFLEAPVIRVEIEEASGILIDTQRTR